MAEIFAAVASGAGLVSLTIQLLESSQKLKGLYNATKDAPKHVKDLCFELETLSLQLRQLEQHRQHDHLNTELLDRCIVQCERRTEEISDVVDDMARYMRRFAMLGKLYTAFKEPEVEKLLDKLERAKSSLTFAYMSYCQ
jgi:chromosome segregation ATPase